LLKQQALLETTSTVHIFTQTKKKQNRKNTFYTHKG